MDEIVVKGKLAGELRRTKKLALGGATTITVLSAGLASIPMTGGLSAFAVAPVAALKSFEIAAIITAASIGVGLIVAIFRGYEENSFKKGELVLRRKQK
ncbi:MAG: hypothetical protein ACN6OP_02965 [Pseudomonadales bacterium]